VILYSLNNDEDRGRGSQRSTRRALTLQYSTGDDVQRCNDDAAAAGDDDDDDDDNDDNLLHIIYSVTSAFNFHYVITLLSHLL